MKKDNQNILIIDTSAGNYVALSSGDLFYERTNSEIKSDNFMILVDEVLKEANVKINDVNVIAVNIGPGSFTGLRVGVTIAKGLAIITKAKLVGFTSFDMIEYNDKEAVIVLEGFSNFVYTNFKGYRCIDQNELFEELKKTQKRIITSEKVAKKVQISSFEPLKFNRVNIVKSKIEKEEFVEASELEPLYLRLSQAEIELAKKEKNK